MFFQNYIFLKKIYIFNTIVMNDKSGEHIFNALYVSICILFLLD